MDLSDITPRPAVRLVVDPGGVLRATLDRPDTGNALDSAMIAGLHAACDLAEQDDDLRVLVIDATGAMFCSGLDLRTASTVHPASDGGDRGFATLLARIAACPVLVVACVDRPAVAGGVGLAAACDVVIAGPAAQFRLTEAMWGLQPANIAPYLIRRMGFQRAYLMALTLRQRDAGQALTEGLADIVSDDHAAELAELRKQAGRVTRTTRAQTKALFAAFWLIDDQQRQVADTAMHRAISDPLVQENLTRYLTTGRFPWEADT